MKGRISFEQFKKTQRIMMQIRNWCDENRAKTVTIKMGVYGDQPRIFIKDIRSDAIKTKIKDMISNTYPESLQLFIEDNHNIIYIL